MCNLMLNLYVLNIVKSETVPTGLKIGGSKNEINKMFLPDTHSDGDIVLFHCQ